MSTPVIEQDSRRGRPSASSIERYWNCKGAWLLESQVPAAERFTTKDAERGTRLHLANQEGDVSGLELSEADLIVRTREIEERIFNQWVQDFQIQDAEIIRERRWWLRKGDKDLCSAKLDFVALSEAKKVALVLDLKSGRKEVTPPVRNLQLRTGVVILTANYNLIGARVGIVAPLQKSQALADYSGAELFTAWDQLETLLQEIEQPNAPRKTGTWCTHCPARHVCPEANARLTEVSKLDGVKWAAKAPVEKVALWDLWKYAQVIGKQIEENVKADVTANPDAFKDWLIKKPNTSVREISDVTGVFSKLAEGIEFTPQEFTALCSVSVGDLVTFIRQKTGKSEKEANGFVNDQLRDFINRKERQGSIERVKQA